MCVRKRLLGGFETEWAGRRLWLRHQPKVSETWTVGARCLYANLKKAFETPSIRVELQLFFCP